MKTKKQMTKEAKALYESGGVSSVKEYGDREGLGLRWCEPCGTDVPSVDADTCLACGSGCTERTNTERAAGAMNTLYSYKSDALGESGPVCEDTASDFLADLMHLCKREGWSFEDMAQRAENNFEEEARRD